jgi:phosphohistidine phosphatase
MAIRLYFLRHGPAADREQWEGSDFDRPLTAQGRERIEAEAKTLKRLDLRLDEILTSPLVRAEQTAVIVADALKMRDNLTRDARLGPGFEVDRLANILREHREASALMLVGHEPSFSETVSRLIGGGAIELRKGGLARVDLPDPAQAQGELAWLLPPRVLLPA